VIAALRRRAACPVCGGRFRRFGDLPQRPRVVCPRCGSYERQRAIALLLDRRPALLGDARSLLHLAAEPALAARIRERAPHLRHVSADLHRPDADLRLDLQATGLPDASFDAVLCSHVLEHVPDDAAALAEIRRVLTPGGWALIVVPQDPRHATTHVDPEAVTPEDRLRAYYGPEHQRLYGRDFPEVLRAAGFAVETIVMAEQEDAERFGLLDLDLLHLCRPEP
jgi:SAM-dependent methyltransferase